jgi:hypothetical protein
MVWDAIFALASSAVLTSGQSAQKVFMLNGSG